MAPGTLVGRYVVLEPLGEGAYGVVYAAYDPELDRKLAVKTFHPTGDPDEAERIAREARAMAKVAHPNVVSVHDVGTFAGGVFIAMELVDGATLRSWMWDRSRSVREVIEVLVAAGRGLAALHAAGIVHRDFKPENVLLGDRGPRVTDFGLARVSPTNLRPSTGAALPRPFSGRAGTPPYMAPEAMAGEIPDERSDQFSFCVALHEALYGKRPQADAATAAPVIDRVPRRVRRIVLRGLAPHHLRYPSMDALLADLTAAANRGRRRAMALVAALALVVTSAAAYRQGSVRPSGDLVCSAADQKLAGVFGPAERAALSRAFAASGKPFAADALRGTLQRLDSYAAAWKASYTDSCLATHARGEQSPALLDRRSACFEERRSELASLVRVLGQADGGAVSKAIGAVESLRPVSDCAAAVVGAAPDEPAAAKSPEARALRDRLDTARALTRLARYDAALVEARAAAAAASALGHPPLEASALAALGFAEQSTGDLTTGIATMRRALLLADRAGDDVTRADAALRLLHMVGVLQSKREEGIWLRDLAGAAVARAKDERLTVRWLSNAGAFEVRGGDPEEAVRLLERGRALLEKQRRLESADGAALLYDLAQATLVLGRYDDAAILHQRALAVAEATLGPSHDLVGTIHSGLAGLQRDLQRFAEAERSAQRAVEIESASLGEDNVVIAHPLALLGQVRVDQRRFAEAIAPLERSLAIHDARTSPAHARRFFPLRALGGAYLGLGDSSRAIAHLERALALEVRTPIDRAEAELLLAKALVLRGDGAARARGLANHARGVFAAEAACPLEHALVRDADAWLARTARASRRRDDLGARPRGGSR